MKSKCALFMSLLIVSVVVMVIVFGCRWEKIERPDISEPDITLAVESTTTTTTTATTTNISNTTTITTTTITDTSWCNTTDTTDLTYATCDVATTVIVYTVQETTARPIQTYNVVTANTECTTTAAETTTVCTTTVPTETQFPASDIIRMTFPATLLSICRNGLFFLPAILLLPLWLGLGGVQMAQAVADALTFVLAVPYAIWINRKLQRGMK